MDFVDDDLQLSLFDHPGKFGKVASARMHEKMATAELGAPCKDISI